MAGKDDFFDGVIQGTIWGTVIGSVFSIGLCWIIGPILKNNLPPA